MIRRAPLSGQWYPDSKKELESILKGWTEGVEPDERFTAGIVPHAGWYYSGKIAAQIIKKVSCKKDIIAVIGGHLPAGSSILAAFENEIEIPDGKINNRLDIIHKAMNRLKISEDIYNDNTVEVVIPMVSFFAPEAEILWLRVPADSMAIDLAEEVYRISKEENLKISIIGSTDLTHYGRNYAYTPAGTGAQAVSWVKENNDAGFIKEILAFNYSSALKHAFDNKSACSPGAAVAAARFGELNGSSGGELISYCTSYDIQPAESFVGYAGIVY